MSFLATGGAGRMLTTATSSTLGKYVQVSMPFTSPNEPVHEALVLPPVFCPYARWSLLLSYPVAGSAWSMAGGLIPHKATPGVPTLTPSEV